MSIDGLPYSVARPALDAVDGDESAAGAYGDAVVARADGRIGDLHAVAPLDVDAVRVGAVPRRGDVEPPHVDAAALDDGDVHLRAVAAAELAQLQVVAAHQLQRLPCHRDEQIRESNAKASSREREERTHEK